MRKVGLPVAARPDYQVVGLPRLFDVPRRIAGGVARHSEFRREALDSTRRTPDRSPRQDDRIGGFAYLLGRVKEETWQADRQQGSDIEERIR